MNLYAYVGGNPINAIDPNGLKVLCASNYDKKGEWTESSITEKWEKNGVNVAFAPLVGTCHWKKVRRGKRKRDITDIQLCWDTCTGKKWQKIGNTTTEKESFEEVVDTDTTPVKWLYPVGGGSSSWLYTCDRNYRQPLLPDKR